MNSKKEKGEYDMFQVAICNDEHLFCEYIKGQILAFSKRIQAECNIRVYNTGAALLESLEQRNRVDLLFLDIGLADGNGIELGKFIREELQDFQMQLVYLSHEQGYAMQLFQTEPMDFLIKPIRKEQLDGVLRRFFRQQTGMRKSFMYKRGHGVGQVPFDSILYFQSMNHKVVIHTTEGQREFYGQLGEVEDAVPDYFIRIHKSYLVNEHFISRFQYEKIVLRNGQILTISKSYRGTVQGRVSQNIEKQ